MSEVPKHEGTAGADELELTHRLHTSPTALKTSLPHSDASPIAFPPSSPQPHYSGDVQDPADDIGVALAEGEQSITLDPLVDHAFPSTSSAQTFFQLGSNHSSALENSLSQDLSGKELKKKRRTLTPDELSNTTLQNMEENDQVFRKSYRKIGGLVRPLNPLFESEEENHSRMKASMDLNSMMNVELASNGNHAKDPYVLNINVVVPKEYTQQNIPINVNIIDNSNNCSVESVTSRRDSSMTSTTTQGFMDNLEDVRNSTFIGEPGETEQHAQLVPIESRVNFESTVPEKLERISRSDEILLLDPEIHLSETLQISVKTEPLDLVEKVQQKSGPSKPSTSKPRKATKDAQPIKSNVKKDQVEKKVSSKKTLKPKENVKTNKETATKKGANEKTRKIIRKRNVAMKDDATQKNVEKETTKKKMETNEANKGADKKEKTRKGAPKQVDAKKQPKEKRKKTCKTEKGGDKVIGRGKGRKKDKHGELNKKTKRNSCKEAKLACKRCRQQRNSESESSSECSVCSGEYCRRSSSSSDDDECSCSSSDSSSCSCSSCQNSSPCSDYDSS